MQVIESVHNLATLENGLVVHRKGTVRARQGEHALVAGTMAAPTYAVRGLGHSATLDSCSHGVGRVLSRGMANRAFRAAARAEVLQEARVKVLESAPDEAPHADRNIKAVIKAQRDIVEPVGRFYPRIVRMCPGGHTAEG